MHLISIHAPPRGATIRLLLILKRVRYFNSRPSARGDYLGEILSTKKLISIHAPPRGATRLCSGVGIRSDISIHAPPRGATALAIATMLPDDFNSRPSARGDVADRCYNRQLWGIFQFTPLREGRHLTKLRLQRILVFQFTPLREGRLFFSASTILPFNFNSRPSARGDDADDATLPTTFVFQFTPLREGRLCIAVNDSKYVIFQFTPLREGRQMP